MTVEIKKAIPKYTMPTALTGKSGSKLASIRLPQGFAWKNDANIVLQKEGSFPYYMTYTPSDTKNYMSVSDIKVMVTVTCPGHTYMSEIVEAATVNSKGSIKYTCKYCGSEYIEAIPKLESQEKPKKNTIINYKGNSYEVIKASTKNAEVSFVKSKKNVRKVTIPAIIKVNGIRYKVTAIEKNAFKNQKTLTGITIGKYVTKIGDNAFYGCSKLTGIVIPNKVQSLGANVFRNCKKLKKIIIQSTKFTKKTLAKNAFKGVIKSTKIRVPKTKVKSYKTLFRTKGLSTKVTVMKK